MAKVTNEALRDIKTATADLQAKYMTLQARANDQLLKIKRVNHDLTQKLRERERLEEEKKIQELKEQERLRSEQAEPIDEPEIISSPVDNTKETPQPVKDIQPEEPETPPVKQEAKEDVAPERTEALIVETVEPQQNKTVQPPAATQNNADPKPATGERGRTDGQQNGWVQRDMRNESTATRPFTPNQDRNDRGPRPFTPGDRPPPRPFTPNQDRNDRGPRPFTPGDRPPPRPFMPGNDRGPRPFTPGDRPPPRPFTPGNDRGPRPFTPGDRPPRPFTPGGPRPYTPGGDRPMGNRPPQGDRKFGSKLQIPKDITTHVEKEKVSNYDPKKKNFVRSVDPVEKKAARNKKSILRVSPGLAIDEDERMGSRKRKKPDQNKFIGRPQPVIIERAQMTGAMITVKDLAEKIGKPSSEIIKKLMVLGIIATINKELDYDTALLVTNDFGIELELKLDKTFEDALIDEAKDDRPEDLIARPPVVTIMGHVDHGKTSLLDAIRKTNVTSEEAGGITQHIGAYTVEINGKIITFVDTPGHEAFTAMRARGAQVTDIAVIVVAADDGIMPQTIEAINHAKAAKVPIIIAVNKIDRPDANSDKVKQSLTEYGLLAEEWGGETIVVPVSAKTKEGIPSLLENILLVADVLELKSNPHRLARGTIVEAKLDKGRGPVATVLIQNGTLRAGDTIVAGTAYGRVRAMINDKGVRVDAALPSQPVEVIGFSDVPEAGDLMYAVEEDKLSRQVAEERKDKIKAMQTKSMAKVSLDDLFEQIAQGQLKDLNIIVKADVQGSAEALKQALEKLTNEQVRVNVIHSGVGAITKPDIILASASNAIIIGFNVRPDTNARLVAETYKVDIRTYRIIYNAIEDMEKAMKGLLAPVFEEVVLGHVEIRTTFKVSGTGTIGGCYVLDGKVSRNSKIRLLRNSVVIFEGGIDSLKRFKDDAREVQQGFECGIKIENYNDIKEGDIIEAYEVKKIEQQ